MVALFFIPSKVPRTWTRREWKEAYRWVRVTRKKIAEEIEFKCNMLAAYGTTMPEKSKRELMDDMINPPLLMGPGMEQE